MTTWYDIKLATLQKMFSAEGTTISTDETTAEYLAAMPFVCNEALQLISTAGKFIIKSISIAHFPAPNLLTDDVAKKIHTMYGEDRLSLEAQGAKSLIFEAFGKGNLQVFVGTNLVVSEAIDNEMGFAEMQYDIPNETGAKVRIIFNVDGQLSVKSIGAYDSTFADGKIPSYKSQLRFPMKDYAPDFYQLDTNQLYYEGEGEEEYLQTSEYFQEGDRVLVLPREKSGNYTIYYKAYPEQITAETNDDYVLPIDDEIVPLLPLYMASQLYKDDDNSIAVGYRNEFEVAFERLSQKASVPVAEYFKSSSGWV